MDCGAAGEEGVTMESPHWIHGLIVRNASRVLGFDIDGDAVKELNKKGYNVIYGDCENLKLDTNERFDVIFAGEIIEHLTKPGNFLEGVKKYLKKDGYLILTTPNAFSFFRGIGNVIDANDENPQHVLVQNKKTLEQLLRRHSYEALEIHYFTTPAFYEFKRMQKLRKLLKIPMEILCGLRPQLAHQLIVIAKKVK